ncbi:MAG TPA: glycosyltransferase [Gaiellaceae bacterium]|jgi:glycosyltransferase involved in cell wall biosynthesis
MRILHAIQELRMGGAERIVVTLAGAAEEAGHDAGVASAPGALSAEVSHWFPLPLVDRRTTRVPAAALALERARKHQRPTILHVHNPTMAVLGGLVTVRGRRLPGLVSVHGVPDEDYAASARLLRRAGLPVVACGPAVAEGLSAAGLDVRSTIVNGVGPPPAPAARQELRAEWGLSPERPLVACVGRLVPVKNHALALDALARVPEADLVLVGEGPLLEELRARAERNGLRGRVVFAGLRPDARALIGAADAVLLPSRSEGLPLAALETLVAGTPLVATDVRGLRELLTDGADALLVAPDAPEAMAEALRRALFDADLRASLAEGARDTAARYGEQAMVSDYLRLYEELSA